VVVELSATENGKTTHAGALFAGTGDTLHVSITEPVKPLVPVTVIVELPEAPDAATSTLAGFDDRLNFPKFCAEVQPLTRFVTLIVPIPVAKSHPE